MTKTSTLVLLSCLFALAAAAPVRAGYFQTWFVAESLGDCTVDLSKVDYTAYSHLISVAAPYQGQGVFGPGWSYQQYTDVLSYIAEQKADTKTVISVFNYDSAVLVQELSTNATERALFSAGLIQFAKDNGFSGVDVNYPWRSDTAQEDGAKAKAILSSIQEAITASGASYDVFLQTSVNDAFYKEINYTQLIPFVDYFSLDTTQYYGSWSYASSGAFAMSPLSAVRDFSIEHVLAILPASKLLMGIPGYFLSYELQDAASHDVGAAVKGEGPSGCLSSNFGPSKLSQGELDVYLEDKDVLQAYNADKDQFYVVNGTTWIGAENNVTISNKVAYVLSAGLAGTHMNTISNSNRLPRLITAAFRAQLPEDATTSEDTTSTTEDAATSEDATTSSIETTSLSGPESTTSSTTTSSTTTSSTTTSSTTTSSTSIPSSTSDDPAKTVFIATVTTILTETEPATVYTFTLAVYVESSFIKIVAKVAGVDESSVVIKSVKNAAKRNSAVEVDFYISSDDASANTNANLALDNAVEASKTSPLSNPFIDAATSLQVQSFVPIASAKRQEDITYTATATKTETQTRQGPIQSQTGSAAIVMMSSMVLAVILFV